MLHISLICVGGLKERHWREAADEYIKRLRPFCRLELLEVPESPPVNASPSAVREGLEAEGNSILKRLPAGFSAAALCVEGEDMDSPGFAAWLSRHEAECPRICFMIGGSDGLADSVKAAADLRLSFSRMTYPHQMMRVILLEQLYRAFAINRGMKYHK